MVIASVRRQAIVWINAGSLSIDFLFSDILLEIQIFSLTKMHLIMSYAKNDDHLVSASMVKYPDSKIRGANMGPTWVLFAPDGPHVGPMNLAIRIAPVSPHILNACVQPCASIH